MQGRYCKSKESVNNQYYSEDEPVNHLQYSSPDPDYYGTLSRRLQTKPHNPAGYYPNPLTQQTFSTGVHVEEENVPFYTDIDFLVKRLNQQKVRKHRKDES